MQRAEHRVLVLLVVAGAAAVLLTPARAVWTAPWAPWWSPYLVWGGLVIAGGVLMLMTPTSDG